MNEGAEIFTSDSDAWDDSALIKAWDSTIKSFKTELLEGESTQAPPSFAKPSNGSAKKKRRNKKKKQQVWSVGEYCHAKYTEDGLYYPADIVALCETFATVCYIDYDEESDVMLTDLKKVSEKKEPAHHPEPPPHNSWNHQMYPPPSMPPPSMPPPSMPPPPCPIHHHSSMFPGHAHAPIPQPPCPPHPFSISKCTDESLASMLMSWYKTGYSTGYYQALREHNIVPSQDSGRTAR